MLKCSLLENKFGRMHSIRIELLIYLKVSLPLLTIFSYSNGYDKICPHSSQWNLTSRSYRCVDQKTYICLFDLSESNRTNKTVFRGACGHEDVSREGTKYILNPNLEQVPCDAIQYQPFTFTTNGNSQCALDKSLCKSSGQILASNGSSFADASCRCDYTRGFDYIIPPKDPCSCKPAKEDCSCYIRKCDDDKVMIADYRCMKRVETILPEDIKCPIISRIIPPEDTVAVDMKQFKQVSSSSTWSNEASVILIVIVIIFTVLNGFLFFSDIDSQPKPTVYNAFKGKDITMEPDFDDKHKLIAVKWFNENDKRTELDLSSEQYSGGVPDVPSLTIKDTRMENAGKYFCLLMYDNGETQKALFKLKIIPQVKFYKAILNHRGDKTFIRPAVCDTINKQIKTKNIAVITGREGTGKSKICLELASIYDKHEKDYMVFKVDLSENQTIYTNMVDTLLIIDDQQYTQDSLHAFMEHLLPVVSKRNIKVILTCRNVDLEIVTRVPEIKKLKEEVFIDIDSCLTAEEKEEILRSYMKVTDVTSSSSAESNFRNLELITDLSEQVTLDENAIKVIRNAEPWKGFPLSALLFCSERKFLHLGEKYFTNPPIYLLEELKLLFITAKNESNHANCIHTINDYCVLVYILENSNRQLDINDPDLCRKLNELYQILFRFKYMPEKLGSNGDQKKSIEEAVHRMNNKYLQFHEGVYEFIHPCLLKAMFLSSESMVPYLLQVGSLNDITEFVRSEDYTALENELVIKIGEEYHHILCERLVRHAFENHAFLLHVAQYIYSYWRSSGNNLVNIMFQHIEFILFKCLEAHTGDLLSFESETLSEKSINLGGLVQFSKILMLVDEITYKGRDPWRYGPGSADFLILSGLVSAAMNGYATDRVQTFKILLDEFENRIHSESFVKLCSKPLDIYENTFFHYLMGLNQKTACTILSVHAEMKFTFDTENAKKYTPLDIAAFLGKKDIFKVLNLKTSNCPTKLRKRLKRLVKSGKNEYYYENFKNKNVDYKTKDDGASPEKLEHEDADEKKEEVDKNMQNISFLRKLGHRKEESNEKEKHDKKDVLCFEDFMISIVVNGEIEDYQAIIKLFSK